MAVLNISATRTRLIAAITATNSSRDRFSASPRINTIATAAMCSCMLRWVRMA